MYRQIFVFIFPLFLMFACKSKSAKSDLDIHPGEDIKITSFNGVAYSITDESITDENKSCNFVLYRSNEMYFAATTIHCWGDEAINGSLKLFVQGQPNAFLLEIRRRINTDEKDLLVFQVDPANQSIMFRELAPESTSVSYNSIDLVTYLNKNLLRRRLTSIYQDPPAFGEKKWGYILHYFDAKEGFSGAGIFIGCNEEASDETGCQLLCIHRKEIPDDGLYQVSNLCSLLPRE